jgi:hypothetical protein
MKNDDSNKGRMRIISVSTQILICLFLGGLGFSQNTGHAQELKTTNASSWKSIIDKQGVQVHSRPHPNSAIYEFKVTTVFDAPIHKVVALALDLKHYNTWVENLESMIVFDKPGENSIIYYVALDLPWPIGNRDAVTHMYYTQDPVSKSVTFHYTEMPNFYPEQEQYIRVTRNKGTWTLTPTKEGKVLSVRKAYADPGGWLPAWIINATMDSIVVKSELNIMSQLKQNSDEHYTFNTLEF